MFVHRAALGGFAVGGLGGHGGDLFDGNGLPESGPE